MNIIWTEEVEYYLDRGSGILFGQKKLNIIWTEGSGILFGQRKLNIILDRGS